MKAIVRGITPTSPRKVLVNGSGTSGSSPNKPPVAVYPPARKAGVTANQNGLSPSSPTGTLNSPNAKRRKLSEDDEMTTELIKSQIFAYGKKPEIKLTLFSEMYSCSNCCEL